MELPPALAQAFQMAAGELGMCSAARLFLRELHAEGGIDLVARATDRLGREFPVVDFVGQQWLDGVAPTAVDPSGPVAALRGTKRLLVVGIEADYLDALLPNLKDVEVGLVTDSGGFEPDFRRVLANYDGRVSPAGLNEIQLWAGRRSSLLTFAYGSDGHTTHVSSTWLRVSGPDVRTQFRSLIAWDILGQPMSVYPRWLVATACTDFSVVVGPSLRPEDAQSLPPPPPDSDGEP